MFSGMKGSLDRTAFGRGLVASLAIIFAVTVLNIVTMLHEQPDMGPERPLIEQISSAFGTLLGLPVAWLTARYVMSTRQAWQLILVPMVSAFLFSAIHVSAFVAIRKLAFGAYGHSYRFGGLEAFLGYELPKDIIAFAALTAIFWFTRHFAQPERAQIDPIDRSVDFIVRNGASAVRVKLDDIRAVSSAGNYAEFHLRNGRTMLMRSPLATLSDDLSRQGFLRIHRRWIVNLRHVTGIQPKGSGDYLLNLGDLTATLSRRFPAALEVIQGRLKA